MRDKEALSRERLAHLVKDVFRLTSGALQKKLRAHNVHYSHWTLLRVLWMGDGLTQRQLSEQAGISEPSAFAALQVMQAKGYVTRQKMPDNKKQVRVFLTHAGLQLKGIIVPQAEEINDIALSGIDPMDVQATRRTLIAMAQNLSLIATESESLQD